MAIKSLTGTNTLRSLFNDHLDKRSEKSLFETPVLYEFSDKRPLPGKSGTTMFVPRHIARNSGGELTEGTIISPSATSAHYYSGTVVGYGDAKSYSDFLVMVHEIPTMISDDVSAMAQYAGYYIDERLASRLCAAGTWVSPDGSTAVDLITTTTGMKQRFLFDSNTLLKAQACPTYNDGLYWAAVAPQHAHDLFVNTSAGGTTLGGGFLELTELGARKLERATIGNLGGIRVVESNRLPRKVGVGGMSAKNSGYQAFVMGPGTVASVDLATARLKTFIKGFGEAGIYDPIDQGMTAGLKLYYTAIAMDTGNRLARTVAGCLNSDLVV
jgi:N4-gp56 family major capsid protein